MDIFPLFNLRFRFLSWPIRFFNSSSLSSSFFLFAVHYRVSAGARIYIILVSIGAWSRLRHTRQSRIQCITASLTRKDR